MRPERFAGEDWVFWREKVEAYFQLKKLWGVLSGSEKAPDATDKPDDYMKWKTKNDDALLALKLMLEYSQLVVILGIKSAPDAWKRLSDQFENASMQNIVLRERRYRECRMAETDAMQDHVNKHKILVQKYF